MLTKIEEVPDSAPSVADTSTTEVIEQSRSMPNIYIDQIIAPANAENRKELYADLLTICQEEGVSIKALTDTEMSQLGLSSGIMGLSAGRTTTATALPLSADQ